MYKTGDVPAVAAAESGHGGYKAVVGSVGFKFFGAAFRLFTFCLRDLAVIVRQFDLLAHMADNFVHQQYNGNTVFFAESVSAQRQFKAFRHAGRGQGNEPVIAVRAPAGLHQVALGRRGRLAGRRAYALHVDDDQRNLGHAGIADQLLF